MANIEHLFGTEKLSGLSRNRPRTEKRNVDGSIPSVTEKMKVSFCFEGTAPLEMAAPSCAPCKKSLSFGFSFLAYQSRKTVRIRSHRLEPFSPLTKFTQGRTVFCFYITLRWYFKVETFMKVQLSSIWKKNKLVWKTVEFEPTTKMTQCTTTTSSLRICWMER